MKDLYFIDETTKIIFALVELPGKVQMDFLGIRPLYFTDKDIAKSWYEKTKAELESSEHPMKDKALENLNQLYKGMTK